MQLLRSRRLRAYKRANRRRVLLTSLVAILVISITFGAYVLTCYHADDDAISTFLHDLPTEEEILADGTVVYAPEGATTGIIFYPGGRVEYNAYIPLMRALAEQGIMSALVYMPLNLAVLHVNAADGIQALFPEIDSWYMAGHSLGGAMAASYLSKNVDSFDGLILLGAYSTKDLSDTELRVLSIYGENDGVMDREKYKKNLENLPEDFTEVIIAGGNHAGFGMYGEQKDDGEATITGTRQIKETAAIIAEFLK